MAECCRPSDRSEPGSGRRPAAPTPATHGPLRGWVSRRCGSPPRPAGEPYGCRGDRRSHRRPSRTGTSRASSAASAQNRTPPAPKAGLAQVPDREISRRPGCSSQRSTHSDSSAEHAGVGPWAGDTTSAVASNESTTRRGSRPRAAMAVPARRPCRTTTSSQPRSSVGRAPTSSGHAVSAVSRWTRAAARTKAASRSRCSAASSKRSASPSSRTRRLTAATTARTSACIAVRTAAAWTA